MDDDARGLFSSDQLTETQYCVIYVLIAPLIFLLISIARKASFKRNRVSKIIYENPIAWIALYNFLVFVFMFFGAIIAAHKTLSIPFLSIPLRAHSNIPLLTTITDAIFAFLLIGLGIFTIQVISALPAVIFSGVLGLFWFYEIRKASSPGTGYILLLGGILISAAAELSYIRLLFDGIE